MQLLHFELVNIRQYKHEHIYFPLNGFIGIVGPNGVGKSTIPNILRFIFYGKYEELPAKLIRRNGASSKAPCSAMADFIYQDNFYRIKRSLSNSPNQNFVQRNGKQVASGKDNVNDFIKNDLFRMDSEAFTACYYAAQGDFDAITKMNKSPRIQLLTKLLRIDEIDAAAEDTRKEKTNVENEINLFKRHLFNEEPLRADLKTHQDDLVKLKNVLVQEQDKLKNSELLLQQKEEEIRNSNELFHAFSELTNTKNLIAMKKETIIQSTLPPVLARIEKAEQFKEELNTTSSKKTEYFELLEQANSLNEQKEQFLLVKNLLKQQQSVKESVTTLQQQLTQLTEQVATHQEVESQYNEHQQLLQDKKQHLQESQKNVHGFIIEYQAVVKSIQLLEEKIVKLKQLDKDNLCPTCFQPLNEEHMLKEVERIQIDITASKESAMVKQEEIKELNVQIQTSEKDVQVLEKQQQERLQQLNLQTKMQAQLEQLQATLVRQQEEIERLNQEMTRYPEAKLFNVDNYNQIVDKIATLKPVYERILLLENEVQKIPELIKEKEHHESEIKMAEDLLEKANLKLSKLNFDEVKHQTLTSELKKCNEDVLNQRETIYKANSYIQNVETQIQSIEEKLASNEEKQKEIAEKIRHMANLTQTDLGLKSYKKKRLAKLAPDLSKLMSYLLNTITDGLLDRAEVNEETYEVSVYKHNVLMPYETFSGAQKKIISICQRIAISQLLIAQSKQAKFEAFILDEVFGELDNKNQDAMVEMFENLKSMFSQIILIAHNDHVKELFDHTLAIDLVENNTIARTKWITDDYGNPTWDEESVKELIRKNYSTI